MKQYKIHIIHFSYNINCTRHIFSQINLTFIRVTAMCMFKSKIRCRVETDFKQLASRSFLACDSSSSRFTISKIFRSLSCKIFRGLHPHFALFSRFPRSKFLPTSFPVLNISTISITFFLRALRERILFYRLSVRYFMSD